MENGGQNDPSLDRENLAQTNGFQSEFANSPEDQTNFATEKQSLAPEIHWSASEALEHDRGAGWKAAVILVTIAILLVIAAMGFFNILPIITSISTAVLVVLMVIALFIVTAKPVREVEYVLTDNGISIQGILHPFEEFRAFGVRQVGGLWELSLIPVKRFGMSNTMFIHEDQGENIVDALGSRLPMEEVEESWIDKIAHKLKI